jgi:hypothetical protein
MAAALSMTSGLGPVYALARNLLLHEQGLIGGMGRRIVRQVLL